jgi:hypothetical protein
VLTGETRHRKSRLDGGGKCQYSGTVLDSQSGQYHIPLYPVNASGPKPGAFDFYGGFLTLLAGKAKVGGGIPPDVA